MINFVLRYCENVTKFRCQLQCVTTVGRGDESVTRRGPRAAAGGATVTGRVTQLQLELTITTQLQLGVTGVVCVLYCTALYCTVL